jgi:hypothetical protein
MNFRLLALGGSIKAYAVDWRILRWLKRFYRRYL